MSVQILSEYQNRSEYKVLKKFVDVKAVSAENLECGVLIISGIVLSKLDKSYLDRLKHWLEIRTNQLILLPPWIDVDLSKMFNTSININVSKEEWVIYEEIECDYKIEGKFQDVLHYSGKYVLGANYRKDTGSGMLTILTLPLLDYKLVGFHERFKEILLNCIVENDYSVLEEEIVKHDEFNVSPVHEYIIMLAKAGYELDDSLNRSIKKFFGMEIPSDKIAQFVEELKTDKFIEGNKIAEKGNELIESKKFKAYIRVLKERRLKDGSE